MPTPNNNTLLHLYRAFLGTQSALHRMGGGGGGDLLNHHQLLAIAIILLLMTGFVTDHWL